MARVAFDRVTKVYPGPVVAVDDLSVEVDDGEVFVTTACPRIDATGMR